MEVLRKQNDELNAWFTAAEAQREKESAERREKERQERVHREKRTANPHLEDHENTIQGRSRRWCKEEAPRKSRREEEPNGESRRERTHQEKSVYEGSRRDNHDEARSHRSRRHRNGSHHGESRHSRQEAKMKELEEMYTWILNQVNGEDPKMTAWEMLDDENLLFTEPVRAYAMPDKFKTPRVEKYDGSGDP